MFDYLMGISKKQIREEQSTKSI